MLAELRAKSQITVPREIVSALGLNEGDKFEVTVQNGAIWLVPVAVYPKRYIQELEKEATETAALYKNGKLKSYDNIEDMLTFLHTKTNTTDDV